MPLLALGGGAARGGGAAGRRGARGRLALDPRGAGASAAVGAGDPRRALPDAPGLPLPRAGAAARDPGRRRAAVDRRRLADDERCSGCRRRSARSSPAWCWRARYRHQLEADLAPFKGLLLGLFFITVGAGIDLGLLGRAPLRDPRLTSGAAGAEDGGALAARRALRAAGGGRGCCSPWRWRRPASSASSCSASPRRAGCCRPSQAQPLLLVIALSMVADAGALLALRPAGTAARRGRAPAGRRSTSRAR